MRFKTKQEAADKNCQNRIWILLLNFRMGRENEYASFGLTEKQAVFSSATWRIKQT